MTITREFAKTAFEMSNILIELVHTASVENGPSITDAVADELTALTHKLIALARTRTHETPKDKGAPPCA